MNFTSPFSSNWLTNAHLQTILSFALPPRRVTFERQRIKTPDSDYLDLDFPSTPTQQWTQIDERPIVVVLHGLGGAARGLHLKQFYFHLMGEGFRPIGLNHRGCSGQPNLTQKCQHFGASDDVSTAINWIKQQWNVPIGLVGISAGGNITLKYLAEHPHTLFAAAAISPSFDFFQTARQLATQGRFYQAFLLRTLKRKICYRPIEMDIDLSTALHAKSLWEFDNVATAPLNGFNGVNDYYTRCNPAQFIPQIKTPTLIIRALDDPFHSQSDVLHFPINQNTFLHPMISPHGGHVAFLEFRPWQIKTWAQAAAARFCSYWENQSDA